jgi:nucleoside-diphosphate-sugar epimerase
VARVLVTGASGFIGTALVPRLAAAGHVPRVLVRREPATPPAPPVEVVRGDLDAPDTLPAAVDGCEAVVHLGAATSAGRLDPALAYRVNVGGTTALVEACLASGCRRVLVMSTQHVHLPHCGLYGRTKRIADTLFEDSGLGVTVLRPSLVYGPGTRGVFVKLAALVRKLPVIPVIGPGRWHLRPLYLDDLLTIIVDTLAHPEFAGRTYDVGGPDYVTYDEFLTAICTALGRPCRRVHLPIPVSFALAWTLERLLPSPPLTVENVYGSLLEAPCDLRALLRDYHLALTPLAAGLRRALAEATA